MIQGQLTHPLIIASAFLVAGILKYNQQRFEEMFSYFCVSAWFLTIFLYPEMTVISIRVISRWVILQIAVVQLFFHFCLWFYRRRYKNAMSSLGVI